ncbi:MAG: endonuclease/exonuclease/phosphatase family protein [Salinibacter sp.]|uniref:endonuclease/exonuclease/phosphatase family protein n=1 Tax=Salinibacter sp. TaxID=2065818 RepID=UPI0035D446B4
MKSVLQVIGSITGILFFTASVVFLWARSGQLADEKLVQTKTYAAPPASPDRDTFRVMTYNLGHLAGTTDDGTVDRPDSLFSTNMDQAVDIIRRANPDIVGLQNVDFSAARSGYVHQLDTIATRLGFASAAQAVNWNKQYVPFSHGRPVVQFGRMVSGQGVLSRYPVRRHARRVLARPPQSFWRDAFYPNRLVQVTVISIGGWPLVVMNVHFEALDTATREEQARTVNALYKRLAQQGFPILLLGNFNGLMPTVELATPSDDDTIELLLKGTELRPALSPEETYITGNSSLGTYPADNPRRKLDYIFYRPQSIIQTNAETWCGGTPQSKNASGSPAAHQPQNRSTPTAVKGPTRSQDGGVPISTVEASRPHRDSVANASGNALPSDHCAVTMTFLLPRPKDMLPKKRIPGDKLPSLDSLMSP